MAAQQAPPLLVGCDTVQLLSHPVRASESDGPAGAGYLAQITPVPGDHACWDTVCEASTVLSASGSAVSFMPS